MEGAQIICTTLAMSTNDKLESLVPGDIDYLIVDEACQSVELNNLIPFEHQPRKVILVGDQQQLPATTFSDNAHRTKYSRSLFQRFLENGVDRVMLQVQYRMHPLIREFPSTQFYEGRLIDAESVQSGLTNPTLSRIQEKWGIIRFLDLPYSKESENDTSKTNAMEVDLITALLQQIVKDQRIHIN